ncbi:ABC transporter permease [Jonesiaceae bacterium BS-20]|uniref:ABC transporter permease n=1 Tax=Jonesiaceae bacterium BS-20 TaxID=3120821 RepID=A0AAU7DV61_9MICO
MRYSFKRFWLLGARISAAIFIVLLITAALLPGLLTSVDPLSTDATQVLARPSVEHWFGTDQSGRDIYARVVHGAGTSVLVGLRAVGIALVIGALLGTLAGVAPKWIDQIVSRLIEIVMAFPEFLIALLVVAIVGKGGGAVALGVTISIIPAYMRLARVTAQQLKLAGPLDSAKMAGVGPWRGTISHVVPGVFASLTALAIVGFGSAIVSAAGLSFLGLGVPPPTPEWGLMMSEGKNQLHNAWWITFFPGLALAATVIAITTLARPLQRRLEEGA